MFVRRHALLSPDADAGASGVPSDPQAEGPGSLADAMHFADSDAPQDGEPPADDQQADDGSGEPPVDEQQAAPDDGTQAPIPADPAPPPKPDPVSDLVKQLAARDEAAERRYSEFIRRQEETQRAAAEQAAVQQAAQQRQQRRQQFDAQLRARMPKPPSADAPVEQILQWQQDMAAYTQDAAEARAEFTLRERMEEHLSSQEERIRAIDQRTRAAEAQAEARAAELAVDRDLAQLNAMPEMAWLRNADAEREFLGFWASLQTSGPPVSGIDAARRFMRMFTAVVPHVRQQARNTAQPRAAQPSAPPPASRPRASSGGSPAPRGAARAGSPAANHWTEGIKF